MIIWNYGGTDVEHIKDHKYKYRDDNMWLAVQHHNEFFYEINNEKSEGNAGDIIIISPGNLLVHGSKTGSNIKDIDDWVTFYGDDVKTLINDLKLPLNKAFYIGDTRYISQYIKEILSEMKSKKLGFEHNVSSLFTNMFVKMARKYDELQLLKSPQKIIIQSVRQKMLDNYSKEWTLSELSELAGYSQSYFCALYNDYYNASPIDELLAFRLEIAKSELIQTNSSVTDVSIMCGFSSIQHFSRYFKKYVGMSPSEYSKKRFNTAIY